MKLIVSINSVSLFLSFFLLSASSQLALATSLACPCFTSEEVSGPVTEFLDGAFSDSPSYTQTVHRVLLADNRRFTTRDATTRVNFEENQAYTCENTRLNEFGSLFVNPDRIFHVITESQYRACIDVLRFMTPTTLDELKVFDQVVADRGAPVVTFQNYETQRFLTVEDGSFITTTSTTRHEATNNQWILQRDECPTIGNSAAIGTERICFSVSNFAWPQIILGTNGGNAFRHAPPANILSVYIIQPTMCTRNLSMCDIQLQVAYYDSFCCC